MSDKNERDAEIESTVALDVVSLFTPEVLAGRTFSQLTADEREVLRTMVLGAKAGGLSWADMQASFEPVVSLGKMRSWWREAQWEPVPIDPEGVALMRRKQAAELRALTDILWQELEDLDADVQANGPRYSKDGISGTIEARIKLVAAIRQNQEREAKLLGLDAAMKVEHAGRINLNHATAELEELVAELAGGGVLQTLPLDAEIVGE